MPIGGFLYFDSVMPMSPFSRFLCLKDVPTHPGATSPDSAIGFRILWIRVTPLNTFPAKLLENKEVWYYRLS